MPTEPDRSGSWSRANGWCLPRTSPQREDTGDGVPQGFAALLSQANVQVSDANRRADDALALADKAFAQLADAGAKADRLEAALTDTQHERDEAREAARIATDALKAARQGAARKTRGRLRSAWDGWRGR